MVVIYGYGPMWEAQPFVQHWFQNTSWTYYEFWGFIWWLVLVPLACLGLLFYPASKVGKTRKGFHH